jgi:hypothetical protein
MPVMDDDQSSWLTETVNRAHGWPEGHRHRLETFRYEILPISAGEITGYLPADLATIR